MNPSLGRPCLVTPLACPIMTTNPPTPSLRLGPEPPTEPPRHGTPDGTDQVTDAAIDWAGLGDVIRHYALGLTRSTHQADDLAQETLARLIARGTGSIDDPRAYAIRTATHLWLSRQRSMGRRAARLAVLARTLIQTDRPRPDTLERAEQLRLIEQRVAALPPRQRAALVLRCVEGLDHDAIATALGCSIGAARSSLHLARRSLRAMLEPESGDTMTGDQETTP